MFGFFARAAPVLPRLARSIATQTISPVPRVPAPTAAIGTPSKFLKAIGRNLEGKVAVEDWVQFWNSKGLDFKDAGLGVKDRKYILWCMEKYRRGIPINEFAHEPPPKKKVRGWGPAVQNGKRIRSRRLKNKK